MRSVAIAEAKDRFSELVAAAEAGEEIVVTRHGKPAVRITAVKEDATEAKRRVLADMLRMGEEIRAKYGPTTADEIVAWKNEGRR